jgi:hypothetical protein
MPPRQAGTRTERAAGFAPPDGLRRRVLILCPVAPEATRSNDPDSVPLLILLPTSRQRPGERISGTTGPPGKGDGAVPDGPAELAPCVRHFQPEIERETDSGVEPGAEAESIARSTPDAPRERPSTRSEQPSPGSRSANRPRGLPEIFSQVARMAPGRLLRVVVICLLQAVEELRLSARPWRTGRRERAHRDRAAAGDLVWGEAGLRPAPSNGDARRVFITFGVLIH